MASRIKYTEMVFVKKSCDILMIVTWSKKWSKEVSGTIWLEKRGCARSSEMAAADIMALKWTL